MTKSLKINNKFIMAIAVLLCIALIGGVFLILGDINAAAEDNINDINPVLTMAEIDSDLEASFYSKGLYTQQTVFEQNGNGAEGGTYHINTNAYCVWEGVDDVAFAYKKYNVANTGSDYIEAEVTIPKKAKATGIKGASKPDATLHYNSSIGIMLRSSLEPDGAETFIHLRGSTILVVYRTATGKGTSVQYTNMSVTFPMKMKVIKKGNQINLSYQYGKNDYFSFRYPVSMTDPGPLYVGLAAHSCEEDIAIDSTFKDFKIKGLGTLTEDGTGGDTVVSTESKYVETDPEVAEDTLLRETFTDGSLTEGKQTNINPIWGDDAVPTLENKDGNLVWCRNFLDQQDFVGPKSGTWYDYEVSVDVQFTDKCNPDTVNAANIFSLMGRHTGIIFYGRCSYAAVLRYGYQLCLYKRTHRNDGPEDQGQLIESFDLRTIPGNEYYADKNVYSKTTDTTIVSNKKYYTYSTSTGYSAVSEPLASELHNYYEAEVVKSTTNTWNLFGDGKFHNLKLRMFDNKISVFFDGVKYIDWVDEGVTDNSYYKIHAMGNVGIGTYQTDCYVDNLLVTEIKDEVNGEYDNIIEGNWDAPIPDYLVSWESATGNKPTS